jgi:acyl carrier protein
LEKQELSMDGIRQIMITRLNLDMRPEEIKENDLLQDDLGLDSIDLLEVAVGIEKTYKIKITQKDTEAFKTLYSLYEFCQARNPVKNV